MRITVFTNPSDKHVTSRRPTWYITTKWGKILFVSGDSENFWKDAKNRGICVADIDMIFLPQGCVDPIRELENFLMCNHKAIIYLPKICNETYFKELCCKFRGYEYIAQIHRWNERIVFMDKSMRINDQIRIFTGDSNGEYENHQGQNMILCEDGIQALFVNDEQYAQEYIQQEAEKISGNHINYIFYHSHGNMKKNCETKRINEISEGQAVVI